MRSNEEPWPLFAPRSRYYLSSFHVHGFGGERDLGTPSAALEAIIVDLGERARRLGCAETPFAARVLRTSPAEKITLPNLAEQAGLFYATISATSPLHGSSGAQSDGVFALPPEPVWSEHVEAAHPLEHDVVALSFSVRDHGRFLTYGLGTRFTDRSGKSCDHAAELEPELLALFGNLRLIPKRS
jgi:hypothetical protein